MAEGSRRPPARPAFFRFASGAAAVTRLLLFANTGWYLFNHRLSLARAAREAGYDVSLASPADAYVQRLQAEGFPWHEVSLDRRGMNPLREAVAITSIRRLYDRVQPDVVHHFTIKPVIYGTYAARRCGTPAIINSVTGLGYVFLQNGPRSAPLQGLTRLLYRAVLAADNVRVIFQNPQDRHLFVGSGWLKEDAAVLIPGSGVDVNRFQPRPEPAGTPLAVYVGRMLWDKGIGELAEAARILARRNVPGSIVLVGMPDEGNPASISEDQLSTWQNEGLLDWWGQRDDMPDVYAASAVVVLPSYGEGLPRTLIEAAASGRAMIATDIPGCREVVDDGINGILVPVKNPGALADAIEELWKQPERRREMALAARKKAVAHFSDALVADRTIDVYRSLQHATHASDDKPVS